jgi:arginyl-tRNA synthetase
MQVVREYQMQEMLPQFESSQINVERSADPKFGDYATNIALKIAPQAKKPPQTVAEILTKRLKEKIRFAEIKIAPPGFINFYLLKEYLREQVEEVLEEGANFGSLDIGWSQKVQVEFISANPTGPLTLGNGRGGFFGDTLANVLKKAGFEVSRAYFINDAGYQVEILGHSILKDEQAQYRGKYIDDLRKQIESKLDLPPKELGRLAAVIIWNSLIRPTIEERMKINFDEWISEQEIRESDLPEKILEILKRKNLTYEKDGALWFKSTEFGDDKDRVLITSEKDGREQEATYVLPDAACHYKKFVINKFDRVVDIWGADHHGYVARLQAFGKALGVWDENNLKIIIIQLVRLFKGGEEVKMSKRAGTYITLDELLENVPLDVARFFFLMYSTDTHMDFNLDLARERSEKNPVYYVQYAHARISSILKKAAAEGAGFEESNKTFNLLKETSEMGLIKQLIRFPEIVEDTAKDYQMQRLPQYSLDLVRAFHKFYEQCRVISEDKEKTRARLSLVEATRVVLKSTLALMGISAPEKM